MKNKLILSESEKNRILEMHKNAMLHETKNFLNEAANITQIQQLLIDKKLMSPTLASGKTSADGELGPVTLNAIYSALTQTQGTQTQGGTNTSGTNTEGGTNTSGTNTEGTNQIKGGPLTGLFISRVDNKTFKYGDTVPFEFNQGLKNSGKGNITITGFTGYDMKTDLKLPMTLPPGGSTGKFNVNLYLRQGSFNPNQEYDSSAFLLTDGKKPRYQLYLRGNFKVT